MLWIEPGLVVGVATLGGILGGVIMAIVQKSTHSINMKIMEDYWNSDIKRLQSSIEGLKQKLSTESVNNPVNKSEKINHGLYANPMRHF